MNGSEETGNVRTVFVFLDLPFHFEFRAGSLPLINKDVEIIFESMTLKSPKAPGKSRTIEGSYIVERRILRFGSLKPSFSGLTQYLEMNKL